MSRRRLVQFAAIPTAFALSVAATLAWAWTGGADQIGLSLSDPTVSVPAMSPPEAPETAEPGVVPPVFRAPSSAAPSAAATSATAAAASVLAPAPAPRIANIAAPGFAAAITQPQQQQQQRRGGRCYTGHNLVPTCGVLWGVAPGAHTESRGASALSRFERKTGRHQAIYHAYHGGTRQLFPTEQEIAIAHQPGNKRILFLNWKPESASWAKIAKGDRRTDAFIDRLAVHIKKNFPEQFFFAVHHEGENDVRERAGSGYTARDYAAMYRHVVKRLRAKGADNIVTVLVHMAYVPHAQKSWFNHMYPGDDVVDWIGFDTYAYSDPGYGHGDFAEILNRRLEGKRAWPGFYSWAVARHPNKPLMLAEWGVWSSKRNTRYKADFYRRMGDDIRKFPRIKAMVQFETPSNQKGQDSSVDSTPAALDAYRKLGRLPIFQVAVTPRR
ncbi:glycoside hydrolase family 26 protein [Paractinoplanes atraurantiacus]|uniref:Glycosyl hydrolase family 26 n=1 Tax=Paractinoplanes atraurantiacus TaxID=1036182 RepID=A0A285IXJ6_9ACTN|nr:glycosyl hydrolase [Actinoplanes atraurantiacus]SNY51641.1 Glycosyl hydrolase family 26 [Actinoplanes atraurantiacus]